MRGSLGGGATLVALAPVVDDRLRGWREGEVEFRCSPAFDGPPRGWSVDLGLEADEGLMAAGEVPSPRYSLRTVRSVDGRLVVEAGYTDWSFVDKAQGVLFRGERPDLHREMCESWRHSSESIAARGRPVGFSHHLAVHAVVLTGDGFLVSCERSAVSNQRGRISLSIEEQMEVGHVSSRRWADARRLERVDGDADPFATARRGLREELGLVEEPLTLTILGVAVEDASIAVNFLTFVEVGASLSDVIRSSASAVDASENVVLEQDQAVRMTSAGAVDRRSAALGSSDTATPWHSSSLLRSRLATAHLHGMRAAWPQWSPRVPSASLS